MVLHKYCASGNDFLIFHTISEKERRELAIKLCDRHYGFGADGLIVLLPTDGHSFKWDFYNSDGTKADMCGNGARAAALYAFDMEIAGKNQSFLTGAGVIKATVFDGAVVEVELSRAKLIKDEFFESGFNWKLIDTGVPHLVAKCDGDFFDTDLAKQMRQKYNANVNFYYANGESLFVRTFERGVEAETLACGTGMSACAIAHNGGAESQNEIEITPKSGEKVWIKFYGGRVFFRGVVKRVGAVIGEF